MPSHLSHFYDEPIEVVFQEPPMLLKRPSYPSAVIWRNEFYPVEEMLETWQDFRRRGKYARNMQPKHLQTASTRGSWGVGRFYFRLRVEGNRIFVIYYDRTPVGAGDRLGHWFILGESDEASSSPAV